MKQILFVNTQSPMDPCAGGIASYICHRACLLSQNDMIVWWSDGRRAARYDGVGKVWESPISLSVRKRGLSGLSNWWLPATPLWSFLVERNIDKVEFPDGVTAQWPLKKPFQILIMCHATQDIRRFLNRDPVRFRHWIKQGMIKRCLTHADGLAACSHEIMWMTAGFYRIHPDYFRVLPHAFHPDAEPASRRSESDGSGRHADFLTIGNFEYVKGADLILDGYLNYKKKGGLGTLGFVGCERWKEASGSAYEKKMAIASREAGDSILFFGRISKKEVSRLLQRARACVVGSRFEAFTMVAGEAVMSGIPLILSSRTGWRTLAARFGAARMCDPFDPEDMARAFFDMEDPILKARVAAGGRALADYLTGETLSKETVKWYNREDNGKGDR